MYRSVSQGLSDGHFLLGYNFFTCNEKELLEEAQYQKDQLVKFINNTGYIRRVTHVTEVNKKHLKRMINILLLVKARSREERRTIFSKL